jgi:hypothetical protein
MAGRGHAVKRGLGAHLLAFLDPPFRADPAGGLDLVVSIGLMVAA